jgi:hypothetical protein
MKHKRDVILEFYPSPDAILNALHQAGWKVVERSHETAAQPQRGEPKLGRSGDQCQTCGFGYILPSLYCDHCDTYFGQPPATDDEEQEDIDLGRVPPDLGCKPVTDDRVKEQGAAGQEWREADGLIYQGDTFIARAFTSGEAKKLCAAHNAAAEREQHEIDYGLLQVKLHDANQQLLELQNKYDELNNAKSA